MADTDGDSRYHLPPHKDGKPEVLTDARKARGDVVRIQTERGGNEFRSLADPLDWYVARRFITGEQYGAGDRLHSLWRGSIIAARYTSMRFGDAGGAYDPESMALMPRDYFRAMDAVGGFQQKRVVRLVCLWKEFAGSERSMEHLRSGLDDLARHFRL